MKNKIIVAILIVLVGGGSFWGGYLSGHKGLTFDSKNYKVINETEAPKDVDYSLLWDAINEVDSRYIDKPIDQEKVLYGAVRGAVAAGGDQYTQFFDPKEYQEFRTELKGSFGGIGAEVGKKNGNLVIIAPIDDSPAQKAGLLPQDIILEVNGKSTQDWSVEQVVKEIRGDKGTEVTIKIYRESKPQPFELKIVRDEIKIKSVKYEYKTVGTKKIAVIHLTRFGDDTKALFRQAVTDIVNNKPDGLVLDLRSNPGGYLDAAVDLASYWVGKDQLVVTEAHSTNDKKVFSSVGYGTFEKLKTVVLINGGSASASEILAGALQDHKIAQLIGEKSFGKGSVQELIDLPKNTAVKITVAKWITPSGKNLNKDGLNPDIKVELTEDNIKDKKDPQMDKALEEVTK